MSDDILGNEAIRERLAEQVALGHLHTCLLFEGPPGVGKAGTATWLASLANCTGGTGGGPRPCGACWSCRQIHKNTHPDVIRVGLDEERVAPIISVRQARDIVARLALHPYNARRRFIIVDPAEAMTVEAANALLKTMEEPPRDTGFVLVSGAAARLLPTVRSRCQRVHFGPVETGRIEAWLGERPARGRKARPDLAEIARLSDGCPGRALELAEGEAVEWRKARDEVLAAVGGSLGDLFAYGERLVKGERAVWTARVDRVLDALSRLVRDAVVVAAGGGERGLYNADRRPVVDAWAAALGFEGAARLGAAIERARADIDAYVNPRLVADTLLAAVAAELGRARTAATG